MGFRLKRLGGATVVAVVVLGGTDTHNGMPILKGAREMKLRSATFGYDATRGVCWSTGGLGRLASQGISLSLEVRGVGGKGKFP